jgi:putative transcriptional regulator
MLWIVGALLLLGLFPRWLDRLRTRELGSRPLEAGLLLVARPGSGDRNFAKTVVLLVEVGPERTTGLVLNRVRTPRDGAFPAGVDRWGGPVAPELHTTLLRSQSAVPGARRVIDGLFWREGTAPDGLPMGNSLTFVGLSVWGPGQLEHELERGGWVLMEGGAGAVFSDPIALWAERIAPHL